jgi:hypothetical protein
MQINKLLKLVSVTSTSKSISFHVQKKVIKKQAWNKNDAAVCQATLQQCKATVAFNKPTNRNEVRHAVFSLQENNQSDQIHIKIVEWAHDIF